jgi:hypothetical protein
MSAARSVAAGREAIAATPPERLLQAQAQLRDDLLARPDPASVRTVAAADTPERDYSSPEVLRAMAHDARRQGRARKQRGSRNVRWTS